VRATGPDEHVEPVVGAIDHGEARPRTEPVDHRPEQREIREVVARALEKQLRSGGRIEVLGALDTWLVGWMEREAEERDPVQLGQRVGRVRPGRHPATERLATREPGKPARVRRRCQPHLADRTLCDLGSIRARLARGHVRKLPAQGRYVAVGESTGDLDHERVPHSGAGTVGDDVQPARPARSHEQPRMPTEVDLLLAHAPVVARSRRPPGGFRYVRVMRAADTLAIALAVAGCHVVVREDLIRPGTHQHVRHADVPTARPPTIVLTDAGRLRFVEPLECRTEDVVTQLAGTQIETRPNLATFVVGIVATSIGAIATIRGLSDSDPAGSPFTYAGLALVAGGLPLAVGPWLGGGTELVPGADRPALHTPGPAEPCGERALVARSATLRVGGLEIRGAVDREGVFAVSPYQLIDAFDTGSVTAWDITAEIDTDAGIRSVTAQLDGGSLATHAKAFLSTAEFSTKIEPIRVVPGIVAGNLRVTLGSSAVGPTVEIAMPIKNDGPGPAWALRGHVAAPGLPSIDGRVLYVGALARGEAREAVIEIPVSTDAVAVLRAARIDLSVELRDAHGTAPATPVRFRGMIGLR